MSYDLVYLTRPDVLLLVPVPFDVYTPDRLWVNGHPGGNGDFHFVMSYDNALEFRGLLGSAKTGNNLQVHGSIQRFVNDWMHAKLTMDGIQPGRDEEVLRKVLSTYNSLDEAGKQHFAATIGHFNLTVAEISG